jgi:hypothetical protein
MSGNRSNVAPTAIAHETLFDDPDWVKERTALLGAFLSGGLFDAT